MKPNSKTMLWYLRLFTESFPEHTFTTKEKKVDGGKSHVAIMDSFRSLRNWVEKQCLRLMGRNE